MQISKSVLEELKAIVGEKFVASSDYARWCYAIEEAWAFPYAPVVDHLGPPDVIVKPQTTEQVSEIVKLANRMKIPITPRGGGEGNAAGAAPPAAGGIMLDMTDMNKFISYDPISRAARFQAGILWGSLHRELAKYEVKTGYMGPHGLYGATVAGGISLDSTGICGAKYGQCSENVVNLQVVLPQGDIIETGSLSNTTCEFFHRYCNGPDLAGLFIGASGALGVITEITMRTYPIEPYKKDLGYIFPDTECAVRAINEMDMYELLDDYVGYGNGAMYDLLKLIIKMEPPQIPVFLYTTAYDEVILERKVAMIHDIAKKYKGVEGPDPKMIGQSAYDKDEMFGGGLCKWLGGLINKTCNVVPLLMVPKINEMQEKWLKEREHLWPSTGPIFGGPSTKSWYLIFIGGIKHGFTLHVTGFCFDGTIPENRRKGYELWHEALRQKIESGTCPYWVGKDAYMQDLVRLWKPEYKEFLRTIKKALDPNNIMNPGALGLW